MTSRPEIRRAPALVVAAACLVVWTAGASRAPAQATSDVTTPEQLAKMRGQNRPYEKAPLKSAENIKPEQTKKTTPEEMLAASVILTDGQSSIILPGTAVLFVPPAKQAMVTKTQEKPLAPWSEFYARNRASIKELALRPEEINGKQPLDEKKLKGFFSGNMIVVSTYLQQPVGAAAPVREAIKKMAQPPQ